MRFVKMHGAGNDFIVVDLTIDSGLQNQLADRVFAASICDRHFGIGADGIIMVLPSQEADLKMRIINSDGSEPEMCGNGIRCFALFAREEGLVSKSTMTVETLAGIITPEIREKIGKEALVSVDMGTPHLSRAEIPMEGKPDDDAVAFKIEALGREFTATAVSMGNPHCVIFTDSPEDIDLRTIGPAIECHNIFPQRTNVEFVKVNNPKSLTMRVWERGAGETLACGTGACASLVAGCLNRFCSREADVRLPGGVLSIAWRDDGRVLMTGPAESVFEGQIDPHQAIR